MRKRFFKWLSRITYNNYLAVFTVCTVLTLVFGYFASNIRMDMTWNAMIPEGHPSKLTFQTVLDEFGTATQIIVALEGKDKEKLINAAQALETGLQDLTIRTPEVNGESVTMNVVKRVEIQYDTSYFAHHGLMLTKVKNLKNLQQLYTDYNLVPYLTHTNDILETEYVQDSDNLTKQENEVVQSLDGLYRFIESLDPQNGGISEASVRETVSEMTVGDGYYLSTDKEMLLVFITPAMSLNDPFDITVLAVNAIDDMIKQIMMNFPEIKAAMTGGHVIMRDEMEVGMEDTAINLMVAFTIILLIFVVSFRMFTGPLLAMLVLMSGITWDIGLAYLFIGRLNLFTAVCSVILIGLGVDFAIHILSAYSEFRNKGRSVEQALNEAFVKIGDGLLTGAITTAFAFLALILTTFPAFREFGFVVGAGILTCLAASLFFLPSAIVMKEKITGKFSRKKERKMIEMEFKTLGKIAETLAKRRWITLTCVLLLTAFLSLFIKDVYMNRNYMDMEPEGLESVRLQREIPKRFNMSPDNMVAVVNSLEEVNRITDILNERPAIGFVESIADYLPSPQKQEERIPHVKSIHDQQGQIPPFRRIEKSDLVEQLYRFSDNLTEMSSMAFIGGLDKVFDKTNFFLGLNEEGEQTGENRVLNIISGIQNSSGSVDFLERYQRYFIPLMTKRIKTMSDASPLTMESVPDKIRDKFISDNGSHYLVTIYSKKDIWDGLLTTPFINTVIQDVPEASGMPLLMKAMIEAAKEQGQNAFLIAFAAFLIILTIDFRSIKTALIATIPLLLAVIWMLGIMGLSGFPFSIINIIGLPLIMGIGIDDGVHIIHRYRIEGKHNIRYSIASIGKAIFLTTMTTLLGFGSLIPSSYRGYGSLGTLVALGIGLCFITSVIVLPAILDIAWKNKSEH